ncbi:hypothetical protein [Undibacterium pigrum]|uniref:Uncharacterized protein n=1 Tax=Undibacterium pigrum TaxID=401470 RepID=A0A318JH42_9BURK|nr:hypothetical protein [Undibacterium pigrum]PXX43048.1 hypothetical protein DFR42_10448 [Undibacterium pigrum]
MKFSAGDLKRVEDLVFSFFCQSSDFNGIGLRRISKELNIDYVHSIDLIKQLVIDGTVSIQSSTNPNIIGFRHHAKELQQDVLENAKHIKESKTLIGSFKLVSEQTEYPICVYPSKEYLKMHRDVTDFGYAKYKVALALAEPQLSFRFFETDVLERYSGEPRFDFQFQDFSGSISCKYDEVGNAAMREEDQIFLKSFGLGFDAAANRVIAVLLCDLSKLSFEHQVFWSTKEIPPENCKVLKDYYDNIIEGDWIAARSVFSALIEELNAIYALTQSIFGISIFSKELQKEEPARNFTFFFSPTSKNYYEFINLLDKYLSENINRSFFEGKITLEELTPLDDSTFERKQKGTLRLLEEWITSDFNYSDKTIPAQIMAPLKKVRRERQTPAHKVYENIYDVAFIGRQKEIMESCYLSIRSIRRNLQTHPLAKNVDLGSDLDEDNVKYF